MSGILLIILFVATDLAPATDLPGLIQRVALLFLGAAWIVLLAWRLTRTAPHQPDVVAVVRS